jgi:antitoxin ParD1/3/4
MPEVEKLSIALTTEQAALVRQVVESGEYASNSEVIRDALRNRDRRATSSLERGVEKRAGEARQHESH